MNQTPANVMHYTHVFDDDGNLIQRLDDNDHGNDRTYGYDEIHRLTLAAGPWCVCIGCSCGTAYAYDLNGNRILKAESGTPTSYSYYPNTNRLASSGGGEIASYSYDNNGNITSDGTHTFAYSAANRLATVDGGLPSFLYDGDGRRVTKVSYQTTYYFYDPMGRLLTEMILGDAYGGGTGQGEDYMYLPDGPLARVDWAIVPNPNQHCSSRGLCPPPRIAIANLLYYHNDQLGTPIAMTNQDADMVWRAEYRPFGDLFSNTIAAVGNNLRFAGQYFDSETGLHQNWFRDYQPKTGRYVEADPIGLSAGTNPYEYANSNPGALVDRTGTTWSETPWLLFKWVFELGPSEIPYAADSPSSRELQASAAARTMRRKFARGGCASSVGLNQSYGTGLAFFDTAVDAISEFDDLHWLNGTQAQLGGFMYGFNNNGDGTVTYSVTNDLSLYSLLYHAHVPNSRVLINLGIVEMDLNLPYMTIQHPRPRERGLHLMGDLTQTFQWTERTPCGCGP